MHVHTGTTANSLVEGAEMSIDQQGWAFPLNMHKAHYFKKGEMISICGKMMNTGDRFDDLHDHKDNCKECMRRRNKLFENKEEKP